MTLEDKITLALEAALAVLKRPAASPDTPGHVMPDGTVCIAPGLYAPAGIYGGNAKFDDQDKVVEKVNAAALHGHTDWRRITDDEGKIISDAWNQNAPPALQGRAAPWFWLASPYGTLNGGRVRRGGEADWFYGHRDVSLPVPVVRSPKI